MANHLTEKTDASIEQNHSAFELLIEQKRYQALKALLLKEEEQRLGLLESYFENPDLHAEKIAQALPSALKKTESIALDNALSDSVQSCIIAAIQENPALYADVLYPVVFPAIKKSIGEAFKEMMQSLNNALEQSLSLNRFAWHYESWRSGIPYREIVLSHTLAYRVEQVFLIHRETGLLLRYVTRGDTESQRDGDAVSAMLTAIQDFIKDSFSVNADDQLDMVEIGEYTVLLNRGPYAVLACVMQGILPYTLREKFQVILSDIHQQHGNLLKNFEGDNEPFAVVESELQRCLQEELKQENESVTSKKYVLIPIVLICAVLSYLFYDNWQFERRAGVYLQMLQHNQGIVITQHRYDHGQLLIEGLYDPLSEHPDTLIEQSPLKKNEVQAYWQAYQSLSPSFVERRLKHILQPTSSVQLKLENNRLIVSGVADEVWINKLALIAPTFAGISEINSDKLQSYSARIEQQLQMPNTVKFSFNNGELQFQGSAPISWYQTLAKKIAALKFVTLYKTENLAITEAIRLQELTDQIEKQSIYFLLNSTKLEEKELQKLHDLIAKLKEVQTLSQQLNRTSRLVIRGYTDGIGSMDQNRELAKKRANIVLKHIDQQAVSIHKELVFEPGQSGHEDSSQRKVGFALLFNDEKMK